MQSNIRKIPSLLCLIFSALLIGCETIDGIKSDVTSFDMDHLRSMELRDLCFEYYNYRSSNDFAKTHSRGLMAINGPDYYLATPEAMEQMEIVMLEKGITEPEMVFIRNGMLQIGFSQNALYAAWGRPYKENRTVSSGMIRIQHVYYVNREPRYAYTENGTLTTWQD